MFLSFPPGVMESKADRCPVFCIANVPAETLNLLLKYVQEYLDEYNNPSSISDNVVILDTKDVLAITDGTSHVASSPTAFIGHTLPEVCDWFRENISQPHQRGYTHHCFLVLDDKTTEDDSCIFVSNLDCPPGEIHSLRCTFDVVMSNIVEVEVQGRSFEDGDSFMGCYMRSGVTMTRANHKLAMDGGLYYEDGEVKLDQDWRDFKNW